MPQWQRVRTADFYDIGFSLWTLGFESHHTCKSAPPEPYNSLMLPKEDYITVSKSVLCMVKKEKKKKESHLLCNSKALQNHSQWSKPH